MITNNLLSTSATGSYSQYSAPPNYLWGTGAALQGALDNDVSALKFGYILDESTDWQNIDTNLNFSVAVKTNGTLWAWGVNSVAGILGDGTSTSKSSPVQIGTLSDWLDIACGHSHTIAVKTNGTLWSWGNNTNGQLGQGLLNATISSPVQVGTLSNWKTVSLSDYNHVAALKTDGTIWTWGNNFYGEIGNGSTTTTFSSPVQVGTLSTWASASACDQHSLFLTT